MDYTILLLTIRKKSIEIISLTLPIFLPDPKYNIKRGNILVMSDLHSSTGPKINQCWINNSQKLFLKWAFFKNILYLISRWDPSSSSQPSAPTLFQQVPLLKTLFSASLSPAVCPWLALLFLTNICRWDQGLHT
jgi:hypothetical protein